MAGNLQEKLEDSRIILIHTEMSDNEVSDTIVNLIKWSNINPKDEISLYVTSESRDFCNVMAIYDTIKSIPNPISVFCLGEVRAFGIIFLAAASKGKRYALKHTEFVLEEPLGRLGAGANQTTEISIAAKKATAERNAFESVLAEAFEMPIEKIHQDCQASLRLKADEAKAYGIIDKVLE